ncbi:NUDIX domain-containing protein [Nocardioides sp. URHA0020]|uniref:NUDIX domain-containing protein n=1 Tax=Nocardioides sp. URHA0020 TaxID=1380392 RepID=UPI00048FA070|nr:NUDIX domain-containing protein [Nocardioides sp. URHA0020]
MHRFACVLLVDPRGWLLLQERDEMPVIDPEKWGLVGGHVEEGEEDEPAAYRELEEETGVRLPPGSLRHWRALPVFHEAYGTLDTTQVYVARVDLTDADIVVGEGRRIVFVDPATARGLDLTASATIAVPEFLDSAAYRDILGP